MLVTCTKTGLTYARKVHREGDVFILTGALEREYKDLSVEAWARKQKKIYSGEVVFRQSTSEELIAAIRDKKLDPGSATVRGHLSKRQLRIALDYAESKEQKKLTGIQMLREGLDLEIEEEAPKEKVEKPEPVKKVEAPAEELELEEEDVGAPKEEDVEEPKVSEEEAEASPEEPEKKSKKDSGKNKDRKK